MPTEAPTIHEKPTANMRSAKGTRELSFVLRCLAYKRKDHYVAECVDLDIVVRAKTANEAIRSLEQAISGHLKVVIDGSIEELRKDREIKGLLPRPSPLSHRVRYHFYCLLAALSGSHRDFRLFDCTPDRNCPSFA